MKWKCEKCGLSKPCLLDDGGCSVLPVECPYGCVTVEWKKADEVEK